MRQLFSLLFLFSFIQIFSQNALPEINNLIVQLDENEEILSVSYDLFDSDNNDLKLTFLVSDNNGLSYAIPTENASGDVGFPVQPGLGKSISWDLSGRLSEAMEYKVKLVANDLFEIDIQEIVDQVDSNRLKKNLEFIAGPRHRISSPDHLEAVKDSIEQAFIAGGLESHRQDVPYGNYTGQNIIGRKEGTSQSESTYIIDAHFDTVSESPGADDNGSGVVGVLEILRVLAPYSFSKSLNFVAFDLEEDGLIGAKQYASNIISEGSTIKGVFNFEMIGYFSDEPNSQSFPTGFNFLYPNIYAEVEADEFRGNFINNIGDPNSVALQTIYANAAEKYVPELKVISITAPANWQTITPDFGRSDHAPFWVAGIPALMLTDGSNFRNPYYHTTNDVVETLDFTFLSNVVKAVVSAIAEEANIEHSTSTSAIFTVSTGLENTLDCNFQLSPNPVFSKLKLSFDDCALASLEVKIFNLKGQVMFDASVETLSNEIIDLDISDFAAGMYLLKVSSGKQTLSRKFIVQ